MQDSERDTRYKEPKKKRCKEQTFELCERRQG